MDFKNKLITEMNQKGLSESSIKNYIRNLEILNDDEPLKNLNFLKNVDNIMMKLENKKPNTKRSYLIGIVSALTINDNPKLKKVHDKYYSLMMEMNKVLKEQESKNEKTETQEKNWIEKNEIDEILNKLVATVNGYKNKDLNEKQYNEVLKMVVLSLYTLQSPRRNADYQWMLITKDEATEDKLNFLIYDKKQFWFRKYKTAKSELNKTDKSELVVDISDPLFENIKIYLKYHPLLKNIKKLGNTDDIPFLVNYNGEPLIAVNAITYIMNRIFKKNIGSSMLRHLYTSHKYGSVLEDMKQDAVNMSHGLNQQKDYIKI